MKKIQKLKYKCYENLAIERPDIKELVDKINELIEVLNNLTK